jgi:presenilin-like A22 family membrane protease
MAFDIRAIEMRQTVKILAMFMIVQFLGLLLATQVFNGVSVVEISQSEVGSGAGSILPVIVGILGFTALLLIVMKFYKGKRFFQLLEAFAIFGPSYVVFITLVGLATNQLQQVTFGNVITYQYYIAALLSLLLVLAKNKWPRLRNTASIIASAGIGLAIGIYLSFFAVLIFMALLAVYDYIAVFITKHMVTMGRTMSEMNLSFLVGASEMEAIPGSSVPKSQQDIAKRGMHALEHRFSQVKALERQGLVPIYSRRELGNGDLAVPLMASVSAYKVYQSFSLSMVVTAGSIFGLLLTFYILNKMKRPLPAIPPLFFGILVALGLYFIL